MLMSRLALLTSTNGNADSAEAVAINVAVVAAVVAVVAAIGRC